MRLPDGRRLFTAPRNSDEMTIGKIHPTLEVFTVKWENMLGKIQMQNKELGDVPMLTQFLIDDSLFMNHP